MAVELLLPGEWRQAPQIGLNAVQSNEFDERLYRSDNIDHSGVPSIYARPYAFSKALAKNPIDEKVMEQFACLVQGLFLDIVQIKSYKLNPGIKLTETMSRFDSRIETYHVLYWQDKPIGGIFPDCFVFPGARFTAASNWRDSNERENPEPDYIERVNDRFPLDVTYQALRQEIEVCLARYCADWVKALYQQWIRQVSQATGVAANNQPVWLDGLQEIANTSWKTSVVAPNSALSTFTSVKKTISLSLVDHSLFNIDLRSISQTLVCDKCFGVKETGTYPELPVKSEFLNLLSIGACRRSAGKPEYTIALKGWSAPLSWQPLKEDLIDEEQGSMLIWPSHKAEAWQVDYVDFAVAPTLDTAYAPRVRLLDDKFQSIGEIENNGGTRTDFPVSYVEVILNVDSNGRKKANPVSAGVFIDDRPRIDKGGTSVTISLDFGTTNTSVGIYDDVAQDYSAFTFKGRPHDLLKTNYWWRGKDASIKNRRDNSYFLPLASGDRVNALPSELVFIDRASKRRGGKLLNKPIAEFTIPHPNFNREQAYEMMVGNFKWSAPDGFGRWKLIRAYLRMVLHMVLSQLRRTHLATEADIVFTYPLAFGQGDFDKFYKMFKGDDGTPGFLAELQKETGMVMQLAIVNQQSGLKLPVAESSAARASIAWKPSPGSTELVVDIGGGTTDFAMWSDGKEFIESIPYGGNVYINCLARTFPNIAQAGGRPIKGHSERIIALQTKIRRKGIGNVLEALTQTNLKTAQHAMDRFFMGIFIYIHQLLRNCNVRKFNIYPLGNGWRLLDSYIPPNNNISSYIQQIVNSWDMTVDVILPQDNDLKGAVCKGARRIADTPTYDHPENVDVKTIVGGSIQIEGRKLEWDTPVPTEGLGIPPLAFDCRDFVDQFLEHSAMQLSNKERSQMVGQLNHACKDALRAVPGGQASLNRSIMAVFLEKVYSKRI